MPTKVVRDHTTRTGPGATMTVLPRHSGGGHSVVAATPPLLLPLQQLLLPLLPLLCQWWRWRRVGHWRRTPAAQCPAWTASSLDNATHLKMGGSHRTSLWGNSYDHSSYDHTRWRTSSTMGSDRADCDACTQLCTLVSVHNKGASSVSILRAMLCWFVHLFPKYGLVKLSQYGRDLQTRHRRYDHHCPGAMIVTVEKLS